MTDDFITGNCDCDINIPSLSVSEVTNEACNDTSEQKSNIAEVAKINSDWSATEHIHDWVQNPNWQQGYQELISGDITSIDINKPIEYSQLWSFIQDTNESVGSDVYEKISNLVQNVRDVDTCELKPLASIANELGLDSIRHTQYDYPIEVLKLVNIFSVKRTILSKTGSVLLDTKASDISTMTDTEYLAYIDQCFNDVLTMMTELCDSSGVRVLNKVKQLFNLNIEVPADDQPIVDLKIEYNIPLSFHVKAIADNIIEGSKQLTDYTELEQVVLQAEFDARNSVEKTLLFEYDKERVTRKYVNFIENLYHSHTSSDDDNIVVDVEPVDFYNSSEIVRDEMIDTCSKILRNIVLDISYSRDYIKQSAQKFNYIGAKSIVQNLITEHIKRHFAEGSVWRKEEFGIETNETQRLRTVLDNMTGTGVLTNVEVVEYFDNTEYFNINAASDTDELSTNERYWEGIAGELAQFTTDHTIEEVLSFYQQHGFDNTAGWAFFETFINHVYNIGATEITNTPTIDTYDFGATTGSIGTNGSWTYDDNTKLGTVTLDIPRVFEWVDNDNTTAFLANSLVSEFTAEELHTAWDKFPSVDYWLATPVINGLDLSSTVQGQLYKDTFNIYSTDLNANTTKWMFSPLLRNAPLELFKSEWHRVLNEQNGDVNNAITYFQSYAFSIETSLNFSTHFETLAIFPSGYDQNDWEVGAGTGLVSTFVGEPFDTTIIGNSYTTSDWKNNSALVTLLSTGSEPYSYEDVTVDGTLEYTTKTGLFTYLMDNNILPQMDTFSRENFYTGEVVRDLFNTYNGATVDNNDSPWKNIKNSIHPTIAFTPFLFNLTKKATNNISSSNSFSNQLFGVNSGVGGVVLEINNSSAMSERFTEFGVAINGWEHKFNDYSGYTSRYENSYNIDNSTGTSDKNIDRDGMFVIDALDDFISNYVANPQDFVDSEYYDNLNLSAAQKVKIAAQLVAYRDDMMSLKDYAIHQYGLDNYGTHIGLYKKVDETGLSDIHEFKTQFEQVGTMWVRFKNHPLPFPLIGYELVDTICSVKIDDVDFPSQINVKQNGTVNLATVANTALDFVIDEYGRLIIYGAVCIDDVSGYPTAGYVSVVTPTFTENLLTNVVEYIAESDKSANYFEGWQLSNSPKEKFIGFVIGGNKVNVITVLVNADNTAKLFNTSEYTIVTKTYNAASSLVNSSSFNFVSKYVESVTTSVTKLQWKLGHSDNVVTIVYPMTIGNKSVRTGSEHVQNRSDDVTTDLYNDLINTKGLFSNGLVSVHVPLSNYTLTPSGVVVNYHDKLVKVGYNGVKSCQLFDLDYVNQTRQDVGGTDFVDTLDKYGYMPVLAKYNDNAELAGVDKCFDYSGRIVVQTHFGTMVKDSSTDKNYTYEFNTALEKQLSIFEPSEMQYYMIGDVLEPSDWVNFVATTYPNSVSNSDAISTGEWVDDDGEVGDTETVYTNFTGVQNITAGTIDGDIEFNMSTGTLVDAGNTPTATLNGAMDTFTWDANIVVKGSIQLEDLSVLTYAIPTEISVETVNAPFNNCVLTNLEIIGDITGTPNTTVNDLSIVGTVDGYIYSSAYSSEVPVVTNIHEVRTDGAIDVADVVDNSVDYTHEHSPMIEWVDGGVGTFKHGVGKSSPWVTMALKGSLYETYQFDVTMGADIANSKTLTGEVGFVLSTYTSVNSDLDVPNTVDDSVSRKVMTLSAIYDKTDVNIVYNYGYSDETIVATFACTIITDQADFTFLKFGNSIHIITDIVANPIIIDLESADYLKKFIGGKSVGYIVKEQDGAYWEQIDAEFDYFIYAVTDDDLELDMVLDVGRVDISGY